MFRPDKKLKRKHSRKRWQKTRNILTNWIGRQRNRIESGLSHKGPPVQFAKRRKYPGKDLSEIMQEAKEKATKYKASLKWYQKLWLKTLNLLRRIRKK